MPISLRNLMHLTGLEFERLCIDLLTIEYRGRYAVRAVDRGEGRTDGGVDAWLIPGDLGQRFEGLEGDICVEVKGGKNACRAVKEHREKYPDRPTLYMLRLELTPEQRAVIEEDPAVRVFDGAVLDPWLRASPWIGMSYAGIFPTPGLVPLKWDSSRALLPGELACVQQAFEAIEGGAEVILIAQPLTARSGLVASALGTELRRVGDPNGRVQVSVRSEAAIHHLSRGRGIRCFIDGSIESGLLERLIEHAPALVFTLEPAAARHVRAIVQQAKRSVRLFEVEPADPVGMVDFARRLVGDKAEELASAFRDPDWIDQVSRGTLETWLRAELPPEQMASLGWACLEGRWTDPWLSTPSHRFYLIRAWLFELDALFGPWWSELEERVASLRLLGPAMDAAKQSVDLPGAQRFVDCVDQHLRRLQGQPLRELALRHASIVSTSAEVYERALRDLNLETLSRHTIAELVGIANETPGAGFAAMRLLLRAASGLPSKDLEDIATRLVDVGQGATPANVVLALDALKRADPYPIEILRGLVRTWLSPTVLTEWSSEVSLHMEFRGWNGVYPLVEKVMQRVADLVLGALERGSEGWKLLEMAGECRGGPSREPEAFQATILREMFDSAAERLPSEWISRHAAEEALIGALYSKRPANAHVLLESLDRDLEYLAFRVTVGGRHVLLDVESTLGLFRDDPAAGLESLRNAAWDSQEQFDELGSRLPADTQALLKLLRQVDRYVEQGSNTWLRGDVLDAWARHCPDPFKELLDRHWDELGPAARRILIPLAAQHFSSHLGPENGKGLPVEMARFLARPERVPANRALELLPAVMFRTETVQVPALAIKLVAHPDLNVRTQVLSWVFEVRRDVGLDDRDVASVLSAAFDVDDPEPMLVWLRENDLIESPLLMPVVIEAFSKATRWHHAHRPRGSGGWKFPLGGNRPNDRLNWLFRYLAKEGPDAWWELVDTAVLRRLVDWPESLCRSVLLALPEGPGESFERKWYFDRFVRRLSGAAIAEILPSLEPAVRDSWLIAAGPQVELIDALVDALNRRDLDDDAAFATKVALEPGTLPYGGRMRAWRDRLPDSSVVEDPVKVAYLARAEQEGGRIGQLLRRIAK